MMGLLSLLTVLPLALAGPPGELLRRGEADRMVRALGLSGVEDLPTYRLDLSLSDVEGRYGGEGTLTWTNTTGRPQAVLPLLLHPNAPAASGALDTGSLELENVEGQEGPSVTWDHAGGTVAQVRFSRAVQPGERVVLGLRFGGRLRRLSSATNDLFAQAFGGLGSLASPVGVSDYGLLGQGDGILTVASAYPMVAPFQDGVPVVQKPSRVGDLAWNQAATFDVRVVTPQGLRVVTNLSDGTPAPLGAGTQVVEARATGVRDLVLVASRDFQVSSQRLGEVEIRSWYLSQDAVAGKAALEAAVQAVHLLGSRLGPYPYRELDLMEATLTGGAGGVEFSGAVLVGGFLYRDPSRSANPFAMMSQLFASMGGGAPGLPLEVTDLLEGQRRFVVVHEVAHQWCPGLMGTDAASSPVVDEALAQYLAGRVVESMVPAGEGETERDRNVMVNYALYRLMGGADGVADRPTSAFGSSLEYAALVYGKAPYLYVDLEEHLGRDGLDGALRRALAMNAWKVVDTDGWLASLEKAGVGGVRDLAERWWRQSQGDQDLGLDPQGRKAMRLLLGDALADQLEASFALVGMDFGAMLRMMGGGAPLSVPYEPGAPSTDEMLRMLREHHP